MRPIRLHTQPSKEPVPPGQYPWDIGQTVGGDCCRPDYTQDFLTSAIERVPGRLFWLIDEVVRLSTVRPEVPAEPMYFILNTAVGGDWPGSPDGTMVLPQYHEIDYIRVYLSGDPGPPLSEFTDRLKWRRQTAPMGNAG